MSMELNMADQYDLSIDLDSAGQDEKGLIQHYRLEVAELQRENARLRRINSGLNNRLQVMLRAGWREIRARNVASKQAECAQLRH